MNRSRIISMIDRHLRGTIGEADRQELFEWFENVTPAEFREIVQSGNMFPSEYQDVSTISDSFRIQLEKKIDELSAGMTAGKDFQVPESFPIHQESRARTGIHAGRIKWVRYAAAAILMFGVGVTAYIWVTHKRPYLADAGGGISLQRDFQPGGEKAMLTLADGKTIILDSAANGSLVRQGNAQVVKLTDGQIAYKIKTLSGTEVLQNTMSTPAGGQYRVVLPDGTRVWLNAASSITYPTAFVGKQRSVKISGEVYFEVEKDAQKPFIIDVGGKSIVRVLGTSLNINSYTNEDNIRTTLIDGSVQIDSSVVLKPGQQGQIPVSTAAVFSEGRQYNNKDITVISNVNMEQILAWKNGFFDFDGLDIRGVMRQLERWYDVKVRYQGPVDNSVFKGKINRKVNLSDVLGMLQEIGVKCQIEGRTIVVL